MWPFRRRAAEPSLPVVRADWRTLPPLQRVVAPHPLINPVSDFSSRLTSWQNPSFLAPLAHAVGPSEPSGSISDVATPADSPGWTPVWAPAPEPAGSVVSRAVAEPVARDVPAAESRSEVRLPEPDAVVVSEAPAVQRSVEAPSRPRKLGLGEPISPVVQRSVPIESGVVAAEPRGGVEPGDPPAGASAQRLTDPPAPRTPGLGMPVVRQPAESGEGRQVPAVEAAGDGPAAGASADVLQRSADFRQEVTGRSATPMVQRAAEPDAPAPGAGVPSVQRAEPGTGSPTAQRLVGDAPGLPVLARPDTAGSAAAPEANILGGPDASPVSAGQVTPSELPDGGSVAPAELARGDFGEPVAQRLVGAEPSLPVTQRFGADAQQLVDARPEVVQRHKNEHIYKINR